MAPYSKARTHCIHRWANNENPDKHGKTGTLAFHGMSLVHYATTIAVKYPKAKTVVIAGDGILNSVSTVAWKGAARQAMPPGWTFVYADCDRYGNRLESIAGLRKCHNDMKFGLKERAKDVLGRRTASGKALAYTLWSNTLDKVNGLGKMLKRTQLRPENFFTVTELQYLGECEVKRRATLEKISEATRLRRERRKQRWQEICKKRAEKEVEEAALWRNHEHKGNLPYWCGTYLRISHDGRHVETSRGVVVTLDDAMRLFKACRIAKAQNTAFTGPELAMMTEGKIGNYQPVIIHENGDCIVGCHHLRYDEMERCFETAKAKGLLHKA